MSEVEKRFHREIMEGVDTAKRKYGYHPSYFLGMVADYGTVGAAKRLLAKENVSDGFGKLFLYGRLDLTVEAYVVKPEYAELFTPEEIAIAKERLLANGYRAG